MKNRKIVTAYCPGDQAINYINQNDSVIISGAGGRLGRSRGDCCGVSYFVVKVGSISLKELVERSCSLFTSLVLKLF